MVSLQEKRRIEDSESTSKLKAICARKEALPHLKQDVSAVGKFRLTHM